MEGAGTPVLGSGMVTAWPARLLETRQQAAPALIGTFSNRPEN